MEASICWARPMTHGMVSIEGLDRQKGSSLHLQKLCRPAWTGRTAAMVSWMRLRIHQLLTRLASGSRYIRVTCIRKGFSPRTVKTLVAGESLIPMVTWGLQLASLPVLVARRGLLICSEATTWVALKGPQVSGESLAGLTRVVRGRTGA